MVKLEDYFFFWGPRGQFTPPGSSCLSQWAKSPFFGGDDLLYITAEHFMMAEKARIFGDEDTRQRIIANANPAHAKSLGRTVKGFDQAEWERERLQVVREGNMRKFSAWGEMRKYLLETGEKTLVEASPYDRVWGIGLRADEAVRTDPAQWPGLNLLGKVLMEVREHFRGKKN